MKKITYLIALLFLSGCQKEEVTEAVTQKESIQLDYCTETIFLAGYGVQTQTKTQYEYDTAGQLLKYAVSELNLTTNAYEQQRYATFTYEGGRVKKQEGYLIGASSPYVKDIYEYLSDGRVSKITEINTASAVTADANFSYAADSTVMVTYTYSNGAGSEYRFLYTGQDIRHDKTTQGGELCNNGDYTYDTKVNPFHKLGYVDFALVNFSKNNLLTANVVYVSCTSPTFIQDTHVYEYNDKGYPTLVTTTFKNDSRLTSERRFYYNP